jgi:hypothetical protein
LTAEAVAGKHTALGNFGHPDAKRVGTLGVLNNGRAEFGSGRGTSPYVVDGPNRRTTPAAGLK